MENSEQKLASISMVTAAKTVSVFVKSLIPYTDIHEAVELAIREYKGECINNKQLLVKDYMNKLKELISDIFNSKYGLLAIEDEKLVGYLMFFWWI